MKILFLGDVIGRNARDAMIEKLPSLRQELAADVVIVNGENSAHGFGITPQICTEFYNAGVDCITTGNHVWDKREIMPHIDRDHRLVRPANFPAGAPGRGVTVIETAQGAKVAVANVMGRLFMDALDDPFAAVDKICSTHRIGQDVQALFIDFHAEATSEKMGMGHYCDGRASVVVGTHTHVPTADARVLPHGTGYQTDAGMTGSYDSVIGMDTQASLYKMTRKLPGERLFPASGAVTICGVLADIDDNTGLCRDIRAVRHGGVLQAA